MLRKLYGIKFKTVEAVRDGLLANIFKDISVWLFWPLENESDRTMRCLLPVRLLMLLAKTSCSTKPKSEVALEHISVLWPPLSSTIEQQRPIICLIQSAHLTPISQAQARHSRQVLQIGWFCLKQQLLLWCVQFLRQIYLSGLYVVADDKTLKK